MSIFFWRLFVLWLIGFSVQNVSAQNAELLNYGENIPTEEEFIKAFEPPILLRGIEQSPVKSRGVSLNIQFEFDSYRLTDKSKSVLNNLGAAMVSAQLEKFRFQVEGHTDAKGARDYNLSLSEQRADAIANYLQNLFGISSSRLDVLGLGEDYLLDKSDPENSSNRRVQIFSLLE